MKRQIVEVRAPLQRLVTFSFFSLLPRRLHYTDLSIGTTLVTERSDHIVFLCFFYFKLSSVTFSVTDRTMKYFVRFRIRLVQGNIICALLR